MRIHLGGNSRQSVMVARAALDAAVKGLSSSAASELSSSLFLAADTFAESTSLRRAISDPSRDKVATATLINQLETWQSHYSVMYQPCDGLQRKI
jgi:F-type H+-transporting ATPase subunit delta